MARYTPPDQPRALQWLDIAIVVAAIFLALWLPLKAGWAGNSKAMEKIDNPTWEALGQTPAQVEQWAKLGFVNPTDVPAGQLSNAHDIIQNRWDYSLDATKWEQLILLTIALVGYFVFLFRASDKEYREVIDEKFNGK